MLTILRGSEDATYNQNMFTEKLLHPYWCMVQKHTQTKAEIAIQMRSSSRKTQDRIIKKEICKELKHKCHGRYI